MEIPAKHQYEYDADGKIKLSKYDEIVNKFSLNRKVLKTFLGSIKFFYRLFSLPGIREKHSWVSEEHTQGAMLPINEELKVDNKLLPYPIITEFIEMSSHRLLMHVCGCRQTYDCKNNDPNFGCIYMGESVLDISPGLGRLISKEEAHEHARKAIATGLVPYVGKGRIDNTLLQIPDTGKLLGLCFCCHCCCMSAAFNHLPAEHQNRLFPRIEEIKFEITDDCTGCETCIDYCLYNAITIENGVAVQNDFCRQCGRCATQCPSNAIKVSMEGSDFKDDIIRRISSVVDIT